MTDILLHARDLTRSFDQFQAVKETDLTLKAGEITVLSGPNGAGKTTLLLCLGGLLTPSSGEVHIEGYDLYRDERIAKQRLAFVPDVPLFYQELTAWEHLRFMALAHGLESEFEERAEELLQEFDLWDARHLFPHAFSRGMRLKLGLLLAFIRPFRVLLLDEPTSALDRESVDVLCGKLMQLRAEGVAVLLTTHDPGLAEILDANTWRMRDGQVEFV